VPRNCNFWRKGNGREGESPFFPVGGVNQVGKFPYLPSEAKPKTPNATGEPENKTSTTGPPKKNWETKPANVKEERKIDI